MIRRGFYNPSMDKRDFKNSKRIRRGIHDPLICEKDLEIHDKEGVLGLVNG